MLERDGINHVDLWKRSNRSRRSLKKIKKIESLSKNERNKCIFCLFLTVFLLFMIVKIESLPSIFDLFKDRRNRFDLFLDRIDLLITKKFDSIEKPIIEIPTLAKSRRFVQESFLFQRKMWKIQEQQMFVIERLANTQWGGVI